AAVPPPATTRPDAIIALAGEAAVARSLRPSLRPDGLERRVRGAAARLTPGRVTQPGTGGTICGVPGLVGERLEPITGRSSGCGIAEPVRLRGVEGIALTTPATITCDTARALQTWVRDALVPTIGRTGGGVSNLRVVASYACRTRNSQSGARLSEHARGNAIDIAGIGLQNGQELTVLTHWRTEREGRLLRQLHQGACGTFGTVLGPNSDRFHQDHFHFDVASYRSGSYCR
ncbi:extensin family protein, partial [Roseibacterium sp. SDUM158016]|uniref:extensin-like domain-containing protein n=1 Tax=Roseicyclus sediminis TaxID=2980997 RepID=UPI0021D2F7B7